MPQTTIYASPRSVGAPDDLPPAVATHELARLFGGSAALAGVSMEVEAGRTVVLLGPNGAGKTTLLRVLATAIRPSFGTAAVDGMDVGRFPEVVRSRVAYLSHATGLYDDLTARENLRFAATMLGLPATPASEHVDRALAEVGLTAVADERVRGYSAGMRRRAALGRVILARPSLVLLDEPFAALDEEAMALVVRLITAWHHASVTVLVASHATERLEDLADAFVRMDGGVITAVEGEGVIADLAAARTGGAPAPRARRIGAGA
jgi:heme exporter protein A